MTSHNPPIQPASDSNAPPMAGILRYNIVGTFRNQTEASEALASLRQQGLADGDTSILGEKEDFLPREGGLSESDMRVTKSVISTTIVGGLIGLVFGIVFGVVVVLIPTFRAAMSISLSLATLIAGGFLGAICGAIVGSLIGTFTGAGERFSGEDTYGDQEGTGPVLVGVRAGTSQQMDRASRALHGCGATDVRAVQPLQRGDG